ncbi:MAG: hypothetical protein LBR12_00140 [Opitutaceae bacterium]|jgi:hypothetical protein|nr:hypothetical protein [Opitutaceae bacterium]
MRFFAVGLFVFAAVCGGANAQPFYEFTGKGANATAFDSDPANWASGNNIVLGVPRELRPGTREFRYSLGVSKKETHLVFDEPRASFTEALSIVDGRLTVKRGLLLFQDLGKDTWKRQGSLLQGRATVTVEDGATLRFGGNLYLDKFRHRDPVPWLVVDGGRVVVGGRVNFLAGEIRLSGKGDFEAGALSFGARYNEGFINFLPGAKGGVKIGAMTFEDRPASFEEMVRRGRVAIDGKRAEWRRFRQTGDTLRLAE